MKPFANNVQLSHRDHKPRGTKYPLSLLAEDVEDPANVGSLFRLADAMGVEHLYLTGRSPTPPNARLRRTARSADDHVSWSYVEDPLPLVQSLKAEGIWVLSLEITSVSVDIRQVTPPEKSKILLILGAEHYGVSQTLLDESAQTAHISMRGHNSSMNVAMAGAVAVFELTRHLPAI
jgi:tRNA G18 (ribose-2'-O)-methylase SpoU